MTLPELIKVGPHIYTVVIDTGDLLDTLRRNPELTTYLLAEV